MSAVRGDAIVALLVLLSAAMAVLGIPQGFDPFAPWSGVVLGAAVMLGSLGSRRRWVRGLMSVFLCAWVGVQVWAHPDRPGRGLVWMMGAVALLAHLWPSRRIQRWDPDGPMRGVAVLIAASLIVGSLALQTAEVPVLLTRCLLAVVYTVPAVFWITRSSMSRGISVPWATVAMVLAWAPAVGGTPWLEVMKSWATPAVGLSSQMVLLGGLLHHGVRARRQRDGAGVSVLLGAALGRPSRVVVLSFLVLCTLGTLLLRAPGTTAEGVHLSWLDAAFTAVSASCVTGLIVVDTPLAFTLGGKVILLFLMQVGGLGIMVFSAAAAFVLGRRLSLSHERTAAALLGAKGRAGLMVAVRQVFLVTAVTELITAALLVPAFLSLGDPPLEAVGRAVFTAVSAFCNAGFALQSNSLIPYAEHPFVLGVVGLAIILGGLGPPVVVAMVRWGQARGRRPFSLHARVTLWTTTTLIVVPALALVAFEWDGALRSLRWEDRLFNALFQSVTLRTAGFNSVPLTDLGAASWLLMVVMMFVGGSPGSTAGGVKTTTVFVLMSSTVALLRGQGHMHMFGRRLPSEVVLRAMAVFFVAGVTLLAILGAFLLTQDAPLGQSVFEVASALGTVGLSVGGTGALDEVGKLVIGVSMFLGRVGPLTFVLFLSAARTRRDARRYPEEQILVG